MNKIFYPIALMVIAITACKSNASPDNKNVTEEQALPALTLTLKDTVLYSTYVADVQAKQNVEIRNKVSGYLEKIYVDEGKEVQKGDLLFQLNAKEFEIELEKARAALASARADAKAVELEKGRVKLLVDKKVIAATEYDLADAKLKAAEAKIREAQSVESDVLTRQSYTKIRAPFSGIIDRIPLKLGSLVNEGSLLTTVSDISAMNVYFNVSENEYLKLLKSSKHDSATFSGSVDLLLADGTKYTYQGKVEPAESEFDQGTGAIAFRAVFANPKKILRHGATGKIQIANAVHNAIMIPQKSVFEIQDKNYVFIIDGNNIIHMQNIVPQARIGIQYIVQSGLQANDKIVIEGVQNIRDGQRISIKQ